MEPPITKRDKYSVAFGNLSSDRGINLIDPPIKLEDYYFWLRDDLRKNPEVLQHLKNENNYTIDKMNDVTELQNNIYNELKSFLKEDYDSYPFPHGKNGWNSKYYYFVRTITDASYPIHCRINMLTKEEEILLNENELADGKENFDLSNFCITDDHLIMSYGIDETGNEKYKLKIINIATKEEQEHNIPELVHCSYFWHKGIIYYIMGNETNRMSQIWRYNFKTKENIKLYQNDNELVEVSLSLSNDNKYFFISADSFDTSDIYYFTENDLSIKHFTDRVEGLLYNVTYHENSFLIVTNKDKSNNFKVMQANISNTEVEHWKEFISYNESIYIEGLHELNKYLLVLYKKDGDSYIKIIPYENLIYKFDNSHIIEINNDIKNISLVNIDIYDTDIIIYSYNSLDTPSTLYEYNLKTKETKFLRQKPIPNFDKELYKTKRIFAISHDGVKVPISIIYKTDIFNNDGTNPVYLYGYGSYGLTEEPDFRTTILPLLNRGFIYAIAHVRGGSFLGYKWYEDGKMEKKMNTFLDFIACAEYLIHNKYTNKEGITIEGRSAGGLLVGASMVMRPELFRTVIAGVPFVDIMNTMVDPSIPLTTPEWKQWGNPNQRVHFDNMLKYSPYDNIKEDRYPNVLALGGLNDPRVPYWEPAKFVAKLRHYNKNNSLILLKIEMEEGHFGGIDRYEHLKDTAFCHAFVLKTYNLLKN